MGRIRNAHKIIVKRHEEKRPLWRTRCGWEDNIKMSLKETSSMSEN